MVKKGNRRQPYPYLNRMWSPGEFCRNCWVGMLDYTKSGCYSILDYAPKIPIKLISFPPNDTQYTRTKLSYFYTRLQTKLRMLGNHTFHSGLNTGAGHTYINHTWEQPPSPPPPARLLYTVYIKKLSNDVKWVYIYCTLWGQKYVDLLHILCPSWNHWWFLQSDWLSAVWFILESHYSLL